MLLLLLFETISNFLFQLDMSCLNALPEYLQNEIRLGYAQQNKIIAEPSSPRKQNMLQLQQATSPSKRKTSPTKKRSPAKTASPSRRKRNSPVFKVPQNKPGRRRKLSAKKLEFTKKRAIVPVIIIIMIIIVVIIIVIIIIVIIIIIVVMVIVIIVMIIVIIVIIVIIIVIIIIIKTKK